VFLYLRIFLSVVGQKTSEFWLSLVTLFYRLRSLKQYNLKSVDKFMIERKLVIESRVKNWFELV